MRRSGLSTRPSSLSGIIALSVVFGFSTATIITSAAVGLLTAVPPVQNPSTVYIGNSAKLPSIKRYQTFSSNAASSRDFARAIHYDSSS